MGGKIFSIFYALIGMPLFLLYLSNIGDIMAKSFKWTYSRCCQCKRKRRRHHTGGVGGVGSQDGGSSLYSVKFPPSTLHPDLVAASSSGEEGGSLNSSGRGADHPALPEPSPAGQLSVVRNSSVGELVLDPSQLRVYEDDEEEESYSSVTSVSSKESNTPLSEVTVPISLCLTVMVSYICGGAVLFGEWEGWGFLDGSYFCFITLTTIGFGDLVPNQQSQDGEQRLALCSLYLLFGIAMIAMSFNLVQEQVINSVKTLGKQLGILKDDDDDDDY